MLKKSAKIFIFRLISICVIIVLIYICLFQQKLKTKDKQFQVHNTTFVKSIYPELNQGYYSEQTMALYEIGQDLFKECKETVSKLDTMQYAKNSDMETVYRLLDNSHILFNEVSFGEDNCICKIQQYDLSNRKQGYMFTYNRNGTPGSLVTWNQDIIDGIIMDFNDDGTLSTYIEIKNNMLLGVKASWDKNGSLQYGSEIIKNPIPLKWDEISNSE